ncbi:hypothetical protein OG782_36820 [Streptomyces sp. NBC_00876]|uniref:hypothetical protein n=1 Tax=Streptomyces sp. NBC_00876 TaxID=2975853 RepID=UPI003863F2EA|nr:hypothetical protein OG782_36820 [Streptomyces sp. NBC_00876]
MVDIEADDFGGAEPQTAQVWNAGQAVLGSLRLDEGGAVAIANDRHSDLSGAAAARSRKGNHVDEPAAVGLGRHGDTGDRPAQEAGQGPSSRPLGVVRRSRQTA